MLQPALLGGLFNGILSSLPFIGAGNCCCCMWVVLGGALAAYLEQQNSPQRITPARGALVGLAAGVIGAFVSLLTSLLLDPIVGAARRSMTAGLIRIAGDLPPEVRDFLEMTNQDPTGLGYLFSFFLTLCVGAVFSTAGGALAAAFMKKDVPPALGGPIQPPPFSSQ